MNVKLSVLMLLAFCLVIQPLLWADEGTDPLTEAIYSEKLDEVKKVFKNQKVTSLKKSSADYASYFLTAVEVGNAAIVKYFFELGYDVNTPNAAGYNTPIEVAVMQDYVEIAKLLIGKGVNLARRDVFGGRLIEKAASEEMRNLIATSTPRTILTSIEEGKLDEVKDWVKKGLDINAEYEEYSTPLMAALTYKQDAILKFLFEKGVKVQTGEADYSLINMALYNEAPETALLLIKAGAAVNKSEVDSDSPLLLAVLKGFGDVVKALVEKGADINEISYGGKNALEIALQNKYNDIARYLMQKGIKVDADNRTNLLFLSVQADNLDFVKTLLQQGASPVVYNERNQSLLHEAVTKGKAMTELVLASYKDVNLRNIYGNTPLHAAVEANQPEVVSLLLAKGAKPNLLNEEYQSPMHLATISNNTQVLDLLVKNGGDLKQTNHLGRTLLHQVIRICSPEALVYLADKDINVNAKDEMGNTALHLLAIAFDQYDTTREKAFWLLDKGADVGIKNAYGMLAYDMAVPSYEGEEKPPMLSTNKPQDIFEAVAQEKPQYVRQFIKAGKSINATDDYDTSLLGIAMNAYGSYFMALWLLNQGADPAGESLWGEPYYMAAYSAGYFKLIKAFFEKGVPKKADEGLLLASKYYNNEAVRYFVEKGASLKVKDEEGFNAIYYAVINNMSELVEYLIKKGTSLTDLYDDKNGLLHLSCKADFYDVTDVLLKAGLSANQKNADGDTPYDLAVNSGDSYLVELIKPYTQSSGK